LFFLFNQAPKVDPTVPNFVHVRGREKIHPPFQMLNGVVVQKFVDMSLSVVLDHTINKFLNDVMVVKLLEGVHFFV
jgi:hypothetical protein